MSYTYELWLTDDNGVRILQIEDYFFLNYTRIIDGIGTVNLGLSHDMFIKEIQPVFRPDRRLEVWRAPESNFRMRMEDTFWLRKSKIYDRDEDQVRVLELSGRNPMGLADRRIIPTRSGTSFSRKTAAIDDMMKEIIRENLGGSAVDEDGVSDSDRDLTATGFFQVQADVSVGDSITKSFAFRNVLEVLRDLKELSENLGTPVHFDIVPLSPTLFEFQTFSPLRGQDRTNTTLLFSPENGNLRAPFYEENYFEARNFVYVGGEGQGDARVIVTVQDDELIGESIWGRTEMNRDARSQSTTASLINTGEEELAINQPVKRFFGTFLNVPESKSTPRSLYGIDWDLGDKVPVSYAGLQFDVEIAVVYVSVNDLGEETITGRNVIGD